MAINSAYSVFQLSSPSYAAPAIESKYLKPQALANVLKQSSASQFNQLANEKYYAHMQACAHAFKANKAASAGASKPPSPLARPPVSTRSLGLANKRKASREDDLEEENYHSMRLQELRPSGNEFQNSNFSSAPQDAGFCPFTNRHRAFYSA
ncbi:hypothetical protein DSO57_1019677 [Entomophthora muscae]|uniref:Uncharacterized protein n=1 Tax=Entomophthora muscae TaxID=34485 RepID=A0ACC2S620_9FUNG|nr:hypothetical protein DSO57_1019677 [Entomophthora muscae]